MTGWCHRTQRRRRQPGTLLSSGVTALPTPPQQSAGGPATAARQAPAYSASPATPVPSGAMHACPVSPTLDTCNAHNPVHMHERHAFFTTGLAQAGAVALDNGALDAPAGAAVAARVIGGCEVRSAEATHTACAHHACDSGATPPHAYAQRHGGCTTTSASGRAAGRCCPGQRNRRRRS